MKRLWIGMLLLVLVLSMPAYAEDQQNVTLYEVSYDETLVSDMQASPYPFPETLLYLYNEEDEILIMLIDREPFESAQAYIAEAYESTTDYSEVSDALVVEDWQDPFGGTGKRCAYRASDDVYGEYVELLNATEYGDYLFVSWMDLAGTDLEWAKNFTDSFLGEKFTIAQSPADEWRTAYVRSVNVVGDQAEITVDFVRFVWGDDEFEYSIVPDEGPSLSYKVAVSADVFVPDAGFFEETKRMETPAELKTQFDACLGVKSDLLFELALKDGEVIWMDYCYSM